MSNDNTRKLSDEDLFRNLAEKEAPLHQRSLESEVRRRELEASKRATAAAERNASFTFWVAVFTAITAAAAVAAFVLALTEH